MVEITILTALAIGCFLVGVAVLGDRIYQSIRKRSKKAKDAGNVIPYESWTLPITEEQQFLLNLYHKEWQVTIETQMHFNDLIMKFRSIALSVLAALIGGSVALLNSKFAPDVSRYAVYAIPGIFWVTAFILDLFYYHRLLQGSVKQAEKFDKSGVFRQFGLGGMTSCVSKHVEPPTSKVLISFYYLFPAVAAILVLELQ